MNKVGGVSQKKQADSAIQSICDQLKPDLEKKNGKTFSKFEAVTYSQQVVAGMNYFIDVDVGENDVFSFKVYKDLQGNLHL